MLPEDQTLAAQPLEVDGAVHAPEALGQLPMPVEVARARVPLDRQRKKVAGPRPTAADVQLLAALLWGEAARVAPTDPARAGALRGEARAALRGVRARSRGKTDALTLEMLGSAEMWLGDDAAATAALEELLARFPQHPAAAQLRVWLASLYLRQHRVGDAVALTREWKPDQPSERAAYALAWVAFEAGDGDRARPAIAWAAARWKDAATRPVVEDDLVFILARSGADATEAARVVVEAAGGDAERRYLWTFKLSEAFKLAGDYEAAARVLDRMIEGAAGQMSAEDLVGFRYRQADYAFRLDRPSEAAARAIQAHEQLAACAARCPAATRQAVIERILKLAQFSHTVYAKSLDGEHYDAAVSLYQHYIAIPGRPDVDAARGFLGNLRETKASADPAAGKHDAEVLSNFMGARREVVAACYERALLAQPGLDGGLRLSIEVDAHGGVTGATSEPGAGAEGIPLVAGCVVDRARTWKFPSRTVPGKTVLSVPVELRRKAAGDPGGAKGEDGAKGDAAGPAGDSPSGTTPAVPASGAPAGGAPSPSDKPPG